VGQDVGFDVEYPVDESRFPRIRAMNVVNLLALALEQHGQTPTRWQLERYPDWAQQRIRVLEEGAQLDTCKPDPAARKRPLTIGNFVVSPEDKLVTYVARNLEPYRGFHVMMRALPELLKRPDVRVVMVGGDDVSYGARLQNSTWRAHFEKELAGTYDVSRVLLPGQVPYDTYLQLLQRSDAHVYLTYPFVVSWSLREALACGCAIVAGDVEPVRELVTHNKTGLLTPTLDPKKLAKRILDLFEDPKLDRKIRTGARRYAETHLDMADYLRRYDDLVAEIVGG
jgi:glycosyltransferase involved in cell wall biosynthesis